MMDFVEQESTADVGFIVNEPAWILESRFFPSKVGGKPAWLDLKNLPDQLQMKCGNCDNPCIFLCQIYCPISELDSCFHRTIFIFMCVDPLCCKANSNSNFKVFRCQIPRKNEFYPYDPPTEEESWRVDIIAEKFVKICHICGAKSTSHCGKCKAINYCTKSHQVLDWKSGHRKYCSQGKDERIVNSSFLLPQFGLKIEQDDIFSDSDSDLSECGDVAGPENGELVAVHTTFEDDSTVDSDLLKMSAVESAEDKMFSKFKTLTAGEHVLRYDRGCKPLWLSSNIPPEVPACEQCGKTRQFEFQVLPQMLGHLNLDKMDHSIDWGTLAVFTCRDNCDFGPAYKPEFLWKQDIL